MLLRFSGRLTLITEMIVLMFSVYAGEKPAPALWASAEGMTSRDIAINSPAIMTTPQEIDLPESEKTAAPELEDMKASVSVPDPGPDPVHEFVPEPDDVPLHETVPVRKTDHAKEAVPVKKNDTIKETVPVKATAPTEVTAPAKEPVPSQDTAPIKETVPARDTAPAKAAVPAPRSAPAKKPASSPKPTTPPKPAYLAGEDPAFAKRYGWPVTHPELPPGSILPAKRIVAYYGNPRSKRMGILGQYPKEEMLKRLEKEVANWEKADPKHKVQPALHLIAVVAQAAPGPSKMYRQIMPDEVVEDVYGWAQEAGAILFIDIQTGLDNIRSLLPRFEWILKNPDVHLAIDPEFNMAPSGKLPGKKIGTVDAADINYASAWLSDLVKKHKLPPKVFVIHRFTQRMVTNADKIKLCPEVAIVMNMDGWGAPFLKRASYQDFIIKEPVQFTGFKLFYHNDTKKGHQLLGPEQILRLAPPPLYIQYQ